MAIMADEEPMTLKEVQVRLGVPPHVLIHLCEKGVIEPDFAETSGRGKRREFSRRNLFEFAVALALRRLELPVASAGLVVRVLRSFAKATAKAVPGFALPGAFAAPGAEFELHLYDGRYLVFGGKGAGLGQRLLLGVSLGEGGKLGARPKLERLADLPIAFEAEVVVDLSQIARKIG